MHLLVWAEDSEKELRSELDLSLPGIEVRTVLDSLLGLSCPLAPGQPLPPLAHARQLLPDARELRAESIREWASALLEAIIRSLPEAQPWLLHVEPHYSATAVHKIGARAWHTKTLSSAERWRLKGAHGKPPRHQGVRSAGLHRCALIRHATIELLRQKRRHLLRELRTSSEPFTQADSLVQLLLTGPAAGFLSVARAPLPFDDRHLISPFPKGEIPLASDKAAPSRAFAKLIEAELRMGRPIQAGEVCVDLGASPGSWTYVAAGRGALVTAVDRSPLRKDLMANGNVRFRQADAFQYQPSSPVDWLLCDVIATPAQSAGLLLDWLGKRWCRHFIVTLKMRENSGMEVLHELKRKLRPLTSGLFLTRLCANKKEVCVFGSAV
jgi:23S rRNA (cytidine2498-2'-O)-methyltransferase